MRLKGIHRTTQALNTAPIYFKTLIQIPAQWVILPAVPNPEQDGKRLRGDPSLVPNLNQEPQGSKRQLRGTTSPAGCEGGLPFQKEIPRVPQN